MRQAARELYEFGLHGVALASGSAAVIDVDHLKKLACRVDRTAPICMPDHAGFAHGAITSTGEILNAKDLLPMRS